MSNEQQGIQLRDQKTASTILYEVLGSSVDRFSEVFAGLDWPHDAKLFRDQYVSLLPEFEATRLVSDQSQEIARFLAAEIQDQLVWQDDAGQRVLSEYLQEQLTDHAAALPLTEVVGQKTQHWQPEFDYDDKRWVKFDELGRRLAAKNVISAEAAEALDWLAHNALSDGELSLKGRKIVVLGAAAEMAPTKYFLQTGAQVLWIDRTSPPDELLKGTDFSGRLHYVESQTDLLSQLPEILATTIAFAAGQPVDLCLYAYAPGQARELRLTGAMNALVNAMPAKLIDTVTMLVSPTTPSQLSPRDLAATQTRYRERPGWEATLEQLGLLGRGGGYVARDSLGVTRTLVSIQGVSYQAAQYLCKVITAECWATHGPPTASTASPIRTSANTAAITQTRSLDHPVFDAAFGGAAALQVETFSPMQSQCLNGLLAIYDWLGPKQPVPGRIRVHGGIHTLPYPLEYALRPAAAIGFVRRPRLLAGFFR